MTPKEILIHYIEQFLLEDLQKLGFKFSKSKLIFERNIADFKQVISFFNDKGQITFCVYFKIFSNQNFLAFKKEHLDIHLSDNLLISSVHFEIKNWQHLSATQTPHTDFHKMRYQLNNEKMAHEHITMLKNNILGAGMAFFDEHTNYQTIADNFEKKSWANCHWADLYLIDNQKDKAVQILENSLAEKPIFNQKEILRRLEFLGKKNDFQPIQKLNEDRKHLLNLMEIYFQRLISENHFFDENSLTHWLQEACDFAILHFDEKNTDKEHWTNFEYEEKIATLFLRLMTGLNNLYPSLSKSQKLQSKLIELFDNEKIHPAGAYLLLALKDAKMDTSIRQIVEKYPQYWENENWAGTFLEVVYSRKISGYGEKVRLLLEKFGEKRGWTATKKQAEKYLANE